MCPVFKHKQTTAVKSCLCCVDPKNRTMEVTSMLEFLPLPFPGCHSNWLVIITACQLRDHESPHHSCHFVLFFAVNDFLYSNERTVPCNGPFCSLNLSYFRWWDNITQIKPIEIKSTGYQAVRQCEAKETQWRKTLWISHTANSLQTPLCKKTLKIRK